MAYLSGYTASHFLPALKRSSRPASQSSLYKGICLRFSCPCAEFEVHGVPVSRAPLESQSSKCVSLSSGFTFAWSHRFSGRHPHRWRIPSLCCIEEYYLEIRSEQNWEIVVLTIESSKFYRKMLPCRLQRNYSWLKQGFWLRSGHFLSLGLINFESLLSLKRKFPHLPISSLCRRLSKIRHLIAQSG